MKSTVFNYKSRIKELPLKPGVYLYKNAKGDIIYIGKAKQLRKRVSSYFSKTHHDKTALLVEQIRQIDIVVTDTEVEALILEARLIRQHQPKFNIDLKDGVRYAYLKVTKEDFPRLLTVRKRAKDGAKYYGPFTDGTARENSARLLRSIFKIRTCAPKLPKSVCLQHYIGNCDAPCVGKISKTAYQTSLGAAVSVLKGGTKRVVKQLEQDMVKFSDRKQYEQAKVRRDQIDALRKFKTRQKMSMYRSYDEDIMHWITVNDRLYIQMFNVDKGKVTGKQEFNFDLGLGELEDRNKSDLVLIASFIKQYYQTNAIPDALIIPEVLDDQQMLEAYLTKMKGKLVKLIIPQRGSKKKLLDLVYKNIVYATEQEDQALLNLQSHLNLSGVPYVIECFDISTIQGHFTVGSMVQFRGGVSDKSNYRRFKIKTVHQQDDFASMAEVVRRRYTRLLKEKKDLPNLIVVDGGKGQLSAAWKALQELELKIPMVGLAKKEEEIYRIEELKPLKLSRKEPGLKLLQQIRDEAHRFAITYHRLLRKKGMKK
jgi:excinuclease ABC subunit C